MTLPGLGTPTPPADRVDEWFVEPNLTVGHVVDLERGRVTVHVAGTVDVATAPALAKLLAAVDGTDVMVDIGDVWLLCSAGLDVLADAAAEVRRRGGALLVTGARPLAARCFHVTGLGALLSG